MAYKPGTAIQDYTTTAGPASYSSAARPTVTFARIRNIRSLQDVVIWAPGYDIDIVSISGNVATYRVRFPTMAHTHTFTGSAMGTHNHTFTGSAMGTHQHDITTVVAAGGGGALTDPAVAGPLESAGGGQTNTNAVDAKTAGTPAGTNTAITAGTPAGTNANNTAAVSSEVPNTTNLAAVTFYCSAVGFANNAQVHI